MWRWRLFSWPIFLDQIPRDLHNTILLQAKDQALAMIFSQSMPIWYLCGLMLTHLLFLGLDWVKIFLNWAFQTCFFSFYVTKNVFKYLNKTTSAKSSRFHGLSGVSSYIGTSEGSQSRYLTSKLQLLADNSSRTNTRTGEFCPGVVGIWH